MQVRVMRVGVMGMRMGEDLVPMAMVVARPGGNRLIVLMLMMFIVLMLVFVLQRIVPMLV